MSVQWSFLRDKRRSPWIAAEESPDGEQIEEADLGVLLATLRALQAPADMARARPAPGQLRKYSLRTVRMTPQIYLPSFICTPRVDPRVPTARTNCTGPPRFTG